MSEVLLEVRIRCLSPIHEPCFSQLETFVLAKVKSHPPPNSEQDFVSHFMNPSVGTSVLFLLRHRHLLLFVQPSARRWSRYLPSRLKASQ